MQRSSTEQPIRHAIDRGYFDDWDDYDPANLQPEGWVVPAALSRDRKYEIFWQHLEPSVEAYNDKLRVFLRMMTDEQLDEIVLSITGGEVPTE